MNKWQLTREWIGYLKRMQIADLNPDPETKSIRYKRQPTVEDLYTFLTNLTDFSEQDIKNSIMMVVSRQKGQAQVSGSNQNQTQQSQPVIKEAFVDDPGEDLSEREVELIFDMLVSNQSRSTEKSGQQAQQTDPQEKRISDLNRIRRHIRSDLTPEMVLALWRQLKNG